MITDHSSVESEVAEQKDLVDAYFGKDTCNPLDIGENTFLFPRALRIIGVNDTLDTVLKYAVNAFSLFPAYQEKAKALCRFLRNAGYRQVLLLHVPAKSPLHHFGASFAKWRWGTLAKVTRELESVRQELVAIWDAKAFKGAQDVNLKLVDEAIRDAFFWHQNKAVDFTTSRLDAFRGWCLVCS